MLVKGTRRQFTSNLTLTKDKNFARKGKLEVKIHIPGGDKDCLNFQSYCCLGDVSFFLS